MKTRVLPSGRGFTLIEVVLASVASAIIFAALYGLFARAVKLRDSASNRMREGRTRSHALTVLRNDLLNAHFVSTEMGGELFGGPTAPTSSQFAGYLRFTTATGRDTQDSLYGDSQEVEYYIRTDEQASDRNAGVLVRTVDRVLLADTRAITTEERLLTGVSSMDVEFYDGSDWQTSWEADDTSTDVPQAVRITIHPYSDPSQKGLPPAPLGVEVPWTSTRAKSATTSEGGSP